MGVPNLPISYTLRNGKIFTNCSQTDAEAAMARIRRMFEFAPESAAFDLRVNLFSSNVTNCSGVFMTTCGK